MKIEVDILQINYLSLSGWHYKTTSIGSATKIFLWGWESAKK